MKRTPVFYLVAWAAPVWGRYEEEFGSDGPGPMAEVNLLFYVAGALALWLHLVWERGWRWRAPPLLLCVASAAVVTVWGADGLGALVMGAAVAAILYGALRRR